LLAVDVPVGGEVPDLAGEARGELGGVEAVDGADAALPGEQAVVVGVDVVPEHGDEPHARDHHPLLGVRLPARRRGRRHGSGGVPAAARRPRRGRGGSAWRRRGVEEGEWWRWKRGGFHLQWCAGREMEYVWREGGVAGPAGGTRAEGTPLTSLCTSTFKQMGVSTAVLHGIGPKCKGSEIHGVLEVSLSSLCYWYALRNEQRLRKQEHQRFACAS
jgi:hypothetical protein